jgi:hypothetical protein
LRGRGAGRDIRLRVTHQLVAQHGEGRGLRTAITTISISNKKVALWHLAQVELVQELAALAFLAEASKPMFAYKVVEVGRAGRAAMFVGTCGA